MADRRDDALSRPRPRPGPGSASSISYGSTGVGVHRATASTDSPPTITSRWGTPRRATTRPSRQVARTETPPSQSGQVVAAAGNAIVTAARVGRLLSRSGWRIAKQIPVVNAVEQQAQRLRHVAAAEMLRLLEVPQNALGAVGVDEQRLMMLVRDAPEDPEPLRSAMTELLERSGGAGAKNRDYLFGSIVSQLVPDEARILAALAAGRSFAAIDVVAAKQMSRATKRTVLRNVSTVGAAAQISTPGDVAHHVTRLHSFGLVEFGPPGDDLAGQFDVLLEDPVVKETRSTIDGGKEGSSRIVRKSLSLSPFGQEFWDACAPAPSTVDQRLR